MQTLCIFKPEENSLPVLLFTERGNSNVPLITSLLIMGDFKDCDRVLCLVIIIRQEKHMVLISGIYFSKVRDVQNISF